MAEVRRRKPDPAKDVPAAEPDTDSESEPVEDVQPKEPVPPTKRIAEEDASSPIWLEILRVLAFLFIASCGLSYLISAGETFTWGMKNPPNYLQAKWWKAQIRGPVYMTMSELAQYDGRDQSKPIYLAINGTIYDVSANRRTYGPGGSYHFFAGTDAARAYVTGCFAEDRTADMRGVEEMYLPIDDPTIDNRYWTPEELEKMREEEMKEALQKVHEGLLHWVNFFAHSKKYTRVGYIKRPKDWLSNEPRRKLCESAAGNRKTRTPPEGK
ncbi:hypothetical protein QBC46DRAFT_151383 [Diplogelasinospora grovesii]|uniref:Cytochrome b5 heme-binding domain-containing protein n=1 Tax=Diplogelasinospora grovesii TaxID=303347 RepID=A0AAN6N6S5_9PEZI|nr:hypothetical protein QBC46DRAFT_151383 [Diplogelasinospora grovesii]